MKLIERNKEFIQTLMTLVIPITLQNFISSSLNMVDNVMIGKLGENEIASVGLVNQYFFIFMLCISGINAGASIFMSQFWGREDKENIKKVLGVSLIVGAVASLIFTIGAVFAPQAIMHIFTSDPLVVDLGVKYVRIIAITFIFTSVTQAYSSALRCTGNARLPMLTSLFAVLINAFLNWVFIFGKLGAPEMGVAGAALATSIARFAEMAIIVVYSYASGSVANAKIKELLSFDFNFIKVYFATSYSVILNELVWVLGMTTYSIIYAKIGIREVASMQIATTVNNMFMVLCIGISAASAIIIGNKIGAGEEEVAVEYSRKLGILTPIIGMIAGVILWVTAPFIAGAFKVGEDTLNITIVVLRIMAVISPLRFYNVLAIIGILRGGGDTTYSMVAELSAIWFYAIPVGFAAVVFFNLSLPMVFTIITVGEEIIKIALVYVRLRSRKWIRNVIDNVATSA